MRVAVRTTAGKQVGFGHVRRCTTLADALRAHGVEVKFFVDEEIAGEHDAVIADDYALDAPWFTKMRARSKLLVIDDLADRVLDADIVTNSALDAATLSYRTAPRCRLLFGPDYALVRSAFRDAAHAPRAGVDRVLVTLGGSDPLFRTRVIVETLQSTLAPSVRIDAVMGPLHGDDPALDDIARRDARVRLHRDVDLAPLVASADLAISGGGQTTFELAAAGVPAVALAIADNQRHVIGGFERAGTLFYAGTATATDVAERLRVSVIRVISDANLRQRMSAAGRRLVDGHGAERVAVALLDPLHG